MRTDRVERLLKLIQTLQSGRSYTVDDLADLVGVHRRTIFRDLNLLSRAGIRYVFHRDSQRYSADHASVLPPVTLSHAEALAMLLATRQQLGSPIQPDQQAAVAAALKIESMLPEALQDYCGPLLEQVEFKPTQASDSKSIVDTLTLLQTVLALRRKIRVRYDSYYEGREIDEVLHPHRLVYIHRGWYVIAFSESVGKQLTFKVERITQLSILEDTYQIDPEFKLDDYFRNAWLMIPGDRRFHVKIRFPKQVAGNVEEVLWHKTQRTTHQEDGSLLFEADVDGIDEISWWVLGYGDQAQVLEPPELRRLIARRAADMHAYYSSPEQPDSQAE